MARNKHELSLCQFPKLPICLLIVEGDTRPSGIQKIGGKNMKEKLTFKQ